MSSSLARASGACILVSWAFACLGADQSVLTLRDALSLTASRNPDLAAFQPRLEAAREQATLQSLRPASLVELQFENFAGSGELSGTAALESTLQFSRVIELGDKARLRGIVGAIEVEYVDATQRARRIDVLAQAAQRFVQVLADQERLQATQRATSLAEQMRAAAASRVAAGAASPMQSSRAEIAEARARIAQEHAEHELASARVALSVLWNETTPAFTEVSGALFDLGEPEPMDSYLRRLDANAEVLAFASHDRVLESRLQLAEAQRRPNLTVSVGVRRLEALDDSALVAGVSLPLGTAQRARVEARSASAERAALVLTRESRRLELHSTLFGLYQELTHARDEAMALQQRILPQAQAMMRTTSEGYQGGRFSFLEVADAQRQLLDIEEDAIRAAAGFHTQRIEIERLTGQPIGEMP